MAAGFRAVHLDFGTGDGAFVLRAARRDPARLVLGVDATADGLHEPSRRALAKPSRGGVANARFGVLSLERAPGELAGLADRLTVLLPWGSLLAAVAGVDPAGLARLAALCRPDGEVRFVFGYGAAERELPLPPLDGPSTLDRLVDAGAHAGFDLAARAVSRDQIRELGTTWAGKLAFSPAARRFVELTGRMRRCPP